MDRTSLIVLAVCFLVLVLWYPLVVNRLYPPRPITRATNGLAVAASTVTATNGGATNTESATTNVTTPVNVEAAVASLTNNAPEELLVMTNENARYTFTSRGGGLKLIELIGYPEKVSARRQKHPENAGSMGVATLNTYTPAPTLGLLNGDGLKDDAPYQLSQTGNTLRAEKVSSNGLTVVKEFELGTNYLLNATVRLENHSTQPISVPPQDWVVGTATPLGASDNGQAVGVIWYNGAKSETVNAGWFANRKLIFFSGTPREEYRAGSSNVLWVAVHNQYFTLAVMPEQPGQEIVAKKIELPRFAGADGQPGATNVAAPVGLEAALVYPATVIAPNQSSSRHLFIYAGPKHYQTLLRIGDRFHNNVESVMDFGWFGFVSKALLLGMNWMHYTLRFSYGWAIVAITLIIKTIYWPLTQSSTRSMKRMQALQPQMNAIREKYKEDPLKANQKTMAFMRENKVSPMGGCLPSLLQIPVFFGFYRMIQNAIELRGAPFLWAGDLTKSDTLAIIPGLGGVPFIGVPGVGLPINLLPLIMGATMLWQARLAPPSAGVDPAQAKMMRYMPLMFMVFLYNFSAGLTLYWTVQNLFTIVQTKLTPVKVNVQPVAPSKAAVLTTGPKKRK